MPLAIVTSDTRNDHGLLLSLNILGVLACVSTMILLTLTALGMVFEEPNVNPVILQHINTFNTLAAQTARMRSNMDYYYSYDDPYMVYLSIIDMLTLPDL